MKRLLTNLVHKILSLIVATAIMLGTVPVSASDMLSDSGIVAAEEGTSVYNVPADDKETPSLDELPLEDGASKENDDAQDGGNTDNEAPENAFNYEEGEEDLESEADTNADENTINLEDKSDENVQPTPEGTVSFAYDENTGLYFADVQVASGISVNVAFEKGVFPALAALEAYEITNSNAIQTIEETLSKENQGQNGESISFEIKIHAWVDGKWTEVQPDTTVGYPVVTFSGERLEEAVNSETQDVQIYHIADSEEEILSDGAAVTPTEMEIKSDEYGAVYFEAPHFSTYTILFLNVGIQDVSAGTSDITLTGIFTGSNAKDSFTISASNTYNLMVNVKSDNLTNPDLTVTIPQNITLTQYPDANNATIKTYLRNGESSIIKTTDTDGNTVLKYEFISETTEIGFNITLQPTMLLKNAAEYSVSAKLSAVGNDSAAENSYAVTMINPSAIKGGVTTNGYSRTVTLNGSSYYDVQPYAYINTSSPHYPYQAATAVFVVPEGAVAGYGTGDNFNALADGAVRTITVGGVDMGTVTYYSQWKTYDGAVSYTYPILVYQLNDKHPMMTTGGSYPLYNENMGGINYRYSAETIDAKIGAGISYNFYAYRKGPVSVWIDGQEVKMQDDVSSSSEYISFKKLVLTDILKLSGSNSSSPNTYSTILNLEDYFYYTSSLLNNTGEQLQDVTVEYTLDPRLYANRVAAKLSASSTTLPTSAAVRYKTKNGGDTILSQTLIVGAAELKLSDVTDAITWMEITYDKVGFSASSITLLNVYLVNRGDAAASSVPVKGQLKSAKASEELAGASGIIGAQTAVTTNFTLATSYSISNSGASLSPTTLSKGNTFTYTFYSGDNVSNVLYYVDDPVYYILMPKEYIFSSYTKPSSYGAYTLEKRDIDVDEAASVALGDGTGGVRYAPPGEYVLYTISYVGKNLVSNTSHKMSFTVGPKVDTTVYKPTVYLPAYFLTTHTNSLFPYNASYLKPDIFDFNQNGDTDEKMGRPSGFTSAALNAAQALSIQAYITSELDGVSEAESRNYRYNTKGSYRYYVYNGLSSGSDVSNAEIILPLPRTDKAVSGNTSTWNGFLTGPPVCEGNFLAGAAITYSNDGGLTYAYTPTDTASYSAVTHVKITTAAGKVLAQNQSAELTLPFIAGFESDTTATTKKAYFGGTTRYSLNGAAASTAEHSVCTMSPSAVQASGTVFKDYDGNGQQGDDEKQNGKTYTVALYKGKYTSGTAELTSITSGTTNSATGAYSNTSSIFTPGDYTFKVTKGTTEQFPSSPSWSVDGNDAYYTVNLSGDVSAIQWTLPLPSSRTITVAGFTTNSYLYSGQTPKLIPTVTPALKAGESVTFMSSNPEFVTVDTDGTLRYAGDGNATVTVSAPQTPAMAGISPTVSVNITVKARKTSAAIEVTAPLSGATRNTTATIPNSLGDFTAGAVSWSPNDTIFQAGVEYTATVTLTRSNTFYSFTGLTGATINGQNATVTNNNGTSVTLSYKFAAQNKTEVTIGGLTKLDGIYSGAGHKGVTGTANSGGFNQSGLIYTYTNRGGETYNSTNQPVNAGDYRVTVSVPDSDLYYTGSAYYDFTVSKKQLSWSANNTVKGKTYDGTDAATINSAPTLGGIVGGEDVTVAAGTVRFASADVGTHSVTASGYGISGTKTTNYLAPASQPIFANAEITPATLTITGFNISKKYDGDNNVTGFGTLSFSGLQNSETATVNTTGITATYDNKNAGINKAITFNGNLFGLTPSGAKQAAASNYTITQPTGIKGTITAETGTVTFPAASAVTYGQTLNASTFSGESGSGTFEWENSGTLPTVSNSGYNVVFAPTDTDNYDYGSIQGWNSTTKKITQKINITVSPRDISNAAIAAISDKTYTGSAIEPTPSVSDGSPSIIAVNDYTVSYIGDTTNVGTVEVKLTGKNNYIGEKIVSFKIVPATITSAAVSVAAPVNGATPQASIADGTGYTGTISWDGNPSVFLSDTVYSATITLTAKANYTFGTVPTNSVTNTNGTVTSADTTGGGSTLTVTVTYPQTSAKTVSSISVITQPKLVYTASNKYAVDNNIDKLDLSSLIVKVNYDDTTTENIAYRNAGLTYKIGSDTVTSDTTVMTNAAHNGKKVEVIYGGKSADTDALTVYAPPTLQIYVSVIKDKSAIITYAVTQGSNTVTSNLQVRNGGSWTDVFGASPYTAGSLTPNTSYEYRLWAKDTVTNKEYISSATFKTAPTAALPGITVGGEIKDDTNPAAIWVTLENGNTVISSVQADAKSGVADTYIFSFSNVSDGIYNLVVNNGSWKVTQAVTIVNGKIINPSNGISIDMSTGKTQSVVDIVTGDTPPAAVGGLPELFGVPAIYTSDDRDLVENNSGTVEIKLMVKKDDAPSDAGKINNAASGQTVGLYLDLSVVKSQFDSTGTLLDETKLIDLGNNNRISITFELPGNINGDNIKVYRVHENNPAEELPESPNTNSDGEYFEFSGNMITLYVFKFSTYAVAYTPKNTKPSSEDSSSDGGSSNGSGTASTIMSTYWIEVPEAKEMAKVAQAKELDYVRSRRASITGIRKDSLLALAKASLPYQHDTIEGNAVQVRVYVDDPAKAVKDILVSGYVKGDTVDKVKARFEKWFINKVVVISMEQQGDFGMKVQIAAKVDLSGTNANNLYFYGYDRQTNKYTQIQTEYTVDANGYLHFATILAGDVIISSGPLGEQRMPQNPLTGGEGIPEPPVWEDAHQSSGGASYMSADATLKLEKVDNQSSGGVLLIDLDAPLIRDTVTESLKHDKISIYVVIGIAVVLLLTAMILWAIIPRKNDLLVPVEGYRKKH